MSNLGEKEFKAMENFFNEGNTSSYQFRMEAILKLEKNIREMEEEILKALEKDLGKSNFEAYISELGFVYSEIGEVKKNLKRWMKNERVRTPISLQPSKSIIKRLAQGICLVVAPWNYPFQLSLSPLIGCIASGNSVVLKASSRCKNTSKLIKKLVEETFSKEYIFVVEGPGGEVVGELLEKYRFDHIFFTGSPRVGKLIMEKAAKNLSRLTLELGGKSPAIVLADADLDLTAKSIAWAKYFNNGQTCVAPDYLLVDERVKDGLIERIIYYIEKFYGKDPKLSKDYGRIIDERHFDSLIEFFYEARLIYGGIFDRRELYISPSIFDCKSLDDRLMEREIFGPLLPVLSFENEGEIKEIVDRNKHPLALYLYTKDKDKVETIFNRIDFGGGCVNNALIHLANVKLPFGGVGKSGMGRYHGRASFENFTDKKSFIITKNYLEPDLKYPPYNKFKYGLIKKMF